MVWRASRRNRESCRRNIAWVIVKQGGMRWVDQPQILFRHLFSRHRVYHLIRGHVSHMPFFHHAFLFSHANHNLRQICHHNISARPSESAASISIIIKVLILVLQPITHLIVAHTQLIAGDRLHSSFNTTAGEKIISNHCGHIVMILIKIQTY